MITTAQYFDKNSNLPNLYYNNKKLLGKLVKYCTVRILVYIGGTLRFGPLGIFQGSFAGHWIGTINKGSLARIGSTKELKRVVHTHIPYLVHLWFATYMQTHVR